VLLAAELSEMKQEFCAIIFCRRFFFMKGPHSGSLRFGLTQSEKKTTHSIDYGYEQKEQLEMMFVFCYHFYAEFGLTFKILFSFRKHN
jgi:hypothetical protein